MTIKLPLILSTMLAAFAISGTYASEASTTPAPDAAAPAMEATPTAATTGASAPTAKKGKKAPTAEATTGEPKKKHYRKHRHHHHGGSGHYPNKWDAPWDYIQQGVSAETYGCSGDTPTDSSPKMPIPEVPGQKTP